jgi:hypothetical protein
MATIEGKNFRHRSIRCLKIKHDISTVPYWNICHGVYVEDMLRFQKQR